MRAFKEGDRVRHIGGGPDMIVHTVFNPPKLIGCEWWVGTDLKRENFKREVLALASEVEDGVPIRRRPPTPLYPV